MEVRRIGPHAGFIKHVADIEERVKSLETRPAGQIVIRDSIVTTDPVTGADTVFGQLPDGSVGIQPFIGDITPPPVASQPVTTSQPGYLTVSWDGLFVNNEDKPRDFEHLNVIAHNIVGGTTVISLEVGVIRLPFETLLITSDIVKAGETWQISFESEDYNGNISARSVRSPILTVQSIVSDESVNEALSSLNASVTAAQEAADAAQGAAQSAQDDADAAAAAALAAAGLAGSKGVIYTQSTAPSGDYSGLWIDTAHNNLPRRYLGIRKALVVNAGGGSSIQTRLNAKGWAVSAVTSTPTFEDAVQYDLVAMDAGYAGLGTSHATLATKLYDRGVSLYTSGNDTTSLPPLFTGASSRGTPKNSIQNVANSAGITYGTYTDGDLNFYLTGVNSAAVITGTTLVTSLGTNQPLNLVMEHPTNFSRWAHIETYATPASAVDAHLNWVSDNWVAIQDQAIISAASAAVSAQTRADQAFNNAAAASEAAGDAQDTADSKNRNWYQDNAPTGTGHKDGDQWFDTNDGNKLYLWKGTPTNAWVNFQDAAISSASQAASGAQASADGKNTIYYEAVAPTDVPVGKLKKGDTWFDTANNYRVSTWTGTGGTWQTTQDAALAKQTADSKGITYTQAVTPPVSARLPQNLWIDISLGANQAVTKYWEPTANAGAGGWIPVADKGILTAQNTAVSAQSAADAKGETIYSSTTPPASKQLPQNLWIDTTGGLNINKRWDGVNGWVVVADSRIASTAVAVTAAQQSADAKSVVYTQATTPPVSARLPQTLWNDTSLGLDKIVVKYWDTVGLAWTALADKAATDAATVVATKTKTWFQSTSPALTGNTAGDLWIDTANGNRVSIWNGAWTVAQDTAINKSLYGTFATDIDQTQPNKWLFTRYDKAGLVSSMIPGFLDIVGVAGTSSIVTDQANLVQNIGDSYIGQLRTVVNVVSTKTISITASHDDSAQIFVDGVSVYTRNSVASAVPISFQLTAGWHVLDFMWTEQAGGDGFFATTPLISSQVTSMYAPVSLTATSQAVSAAQTAANNAQTTANTSMASQAYSTNPSFDDWPSGSAPVGYSVWTNAPVKETAIFRRGPYALRFNVPDATAGYGVQFSSILSHAPNIEYYTVELEFQLVSGTLGAAGFLLDWNGMTNNRAQFNLATEVPNAVTGKWYRVVKTLQRPGNATGTWTNMAGYLMGQYTSLGTGAAKNIIFDWMNVRPATTEEITAYGAPAKYTQLSADTAAKGEVIYSSTAPAAAKQLTQNLWIDTTGGLNIHKRWDTGTNGWVVVSDPRIAQTATQLSALTSQVSAVSAQADRSITTFYGTSTPTGAQEGDLWLSGVAGTPMKRYSASGTWDTFEDPNVQAAYQAAQDAQSAADGKVRTFAQDDEPTGMVPNDVGDLWIDTNDNNKLWRYSGGGWVALQDGDIALAQQAGDNAQLSANGKNKVHYSTSPASGTTDPTDSNRPFVEGDTWFQRNAQNLVIAQWEFTGGAWVSRKVSGLVLAELDAGTITVGYLRGENLSATAINGKTITGATIQTDSTPVSGASARGIKLTTAELAGYDNAGVKNFSLATDGTLAVRGVIKSGSSIEAATITGLEGIQTNPTPLRGVKVTNTGVSAFDASGNMTFRVNGSDGVVEAPGMKANSITSTMISATAIDGKTITGAIIQTDSTPVSGASARGIKLLPTELAGYDTAGVKNFSLATDGTLAVRGVIKAGSSIESALITGTSGVQTSANATTGVKMTNAGIVAYDALNNMTFKVDAATGIVEAPGLKANTIKGDMIDAGTITVRNISIGDFTNVAAGGEFNEATDLANWAPLPTGMTFTTSAPQAGAGCVAVAANAAVRTATLGSLVAVRPGDQFTIEFYYKTTADYNGSSGNAKFRIGNQSGALLTDFPYATVNTAWTKVSGSYTVPADGSVTDLQLTLNFNHTVGTLWLDSLTVRKKVGATLIENNSISTGNIVTGGLDAGAITAGTLTSLQIKGKSIVADKLLITSTDNLIQEADFSGSGVSWQLASDNPSVTGFSINATAGRNSLPAMLIANNATTQTSYNATIVTPGATTKTPIQVQSDAGNAYRVSAWVKSTVSVPVSGALIVGRFRNTSGVDTEVNMPYNTASNGVYTPATMPTAGTWYEITGMVTAPPGTVSVAWGIRSASTLSTGTLTWDMVSATRASNGELVVDGSIKTQHMSAGTIDAGVLTAGTVKATHIAVKSIGVDRLTISSSDNLIVEANFEHPTDPGASWTKSPTNPNATIQVGGGRNGANAMRITGTTAQSTSFNLNNKVVVDQDSRFRASMWVKSNAAYGNGQVRLGVRPYIGSSAGSVMTLFSSTTDPTKPNFIPATNTWTQISGYTASLPAGTTAVEFYISTVAPSTTAFMDFDSVSITRAADATLVVDGAIDGKTITGALFQTDNTPLDSPSTRGIKLNGAGLKAYDPFGLMTFGIDALTGIVSSVGTFSTESTLVNYMGGTTTARAEFGILNNATFNNVPGITFQWGAGNEPNQITSALYSAGGTTTLESRSDAVQVFDQSRVYLNIGQTQAILEAVGPAATEADWMDRAGFYANGFGYNSSSAVMQTNLNKTNTVEGSREMAIRVGEFPGYSDGLIDMYHDKSVSGTRVKSFRFLATPSGGFQMVGYKDYSYTVGARILHDDTDNWMYLSAAGGLVHAAPEVVLTPSGNPNGDQVVLDATGIHLNGTVDINGDPLQSQSIVHMMTASGTMAAATVPVPQIGTLSTSAGGTSGTLATPGTGQITITEAGVYDLSFTIGLSGPMTGRSFIDITPDGQAAWARYTIATSEDSGTASINGVKVSAGQVVKFYVYQTSGGTKTYNATVRIVKVGSPSTTSNWTNTSQTVDGNVTINGTLNVNNVGTYDYTSGVAKMPYIILKKVGNQTLTAANTFYDVAWDGADTYNYQMTHSSSTNNHQITIQKSGIYEINYKLGVNTSTGHVSGQISINGVAQSNFVQRVGNNSGQFEKVQLVQATALTAGDVIAIQAASGTAGAAADAVCVASIRMIVPT